MNFGNAIFNLFIKKLKKALETYYNEKKEFYDTVIEVNKIKGIFCERKWIGEIILKIVFLLLIFSFFWLLVDTIYNLYIYLKMSSFLMVKSNPRLDDNPLFIQIKKLTYFNSYFSIDLLFLIFATTPIFILIKLWILNLSIP